MMNRALLKVWALAAALVALSAVDAAARTITLAWDSSPDTTVTGYRVYWSTQAGTYSDTDYFDVGDSLTWTGTLPGDQYYFVVRAYDADGNLGPVSLEVGDTTAFWLANPGDQLSDAGQVVDLPLIAQGAAVTFDADNLPAGLAVDAASGHILGIPTAIFSTSQIVTARAVDGSGHVSSVQFSWAVHANQAPVVVNPGDQIDFAGDGVALAISALDPDGDSLQYSATNLPPGLTIGATTGIISGTVAATATGVFNTSVTASDGRIATTASFVWQIPTPGTLTVVRAVSAEAIGSTVSTAPFSTRAAGETLIAFVGAAQPTTDGVQTATVSGGGLQWSLVTRANAQAGTSEIWSARAPAGSTDVTVTADSTIGGTFLSLTVVGFVGADGVGASAAASAATGAPAVSLTTTRAGSLVFGTGNDWDAAVSRTLAAGQELIHEALNQGGDTIWVQRIAGAIAAAGTPVTVADTEPTTHRWNFAAVEIVGPSQAAATVVLTPAVAVPGSSLSAAIAGAQGNPGDWAGLFNVTADATHFVARQYLNGSTTPPVNGVTSAQLSFTAPAQPGQYNVRLFGAADPTTPIAVSNAILVPASLSIDDLSKTEGSASSSMVFTVTLSAPSPVPVSVHYATADGTAQAGSDYVAASGTLVFPPGTTKQTIAVTINGDTTGESAETFRVMLSNATNAVIADAQGVGTILNDDTKTVVQQMFGFGAFADGKLRHRFVFRVKERGGHDYARLEFWSSEPVKGKGIDDGDRQGSLDKDYQHDHRAAKNRFETTAVRSVTFGPRDGKVQAVTFTGAGAWNGKAGYTFEARASDRGEPGRGRDTFALVVKDSRGTVVLNVSATIDEGNNQATPASKR